MNRSSANANANPNDRTLLASVKKTYERFLKIRGHPRAIALGFALGLFVGMTPFMGLHTLVAVTVAALFKWNKISAAVSVWITNAVTAPIIYSITYLVGARMMGIEKVFKLKDINSYSAVKDLILKTPEIVWAMIVGGLVIGLPLAVIGYYVSFSITSRYQEEIRIKIARSKEKLAQKRKLRKVTTMDDAGRELPSANPGTENPSNPDPDRSTGISDR